MSTCSRCGNEVEFRYINGKCIPLHVSGGCITEGRSVVSDYSGYSESKDSCCFITNCPICNSLVFFLRHNGGSVWIDPPLGPPWYKHACFLSPDDSGSGAKSLVEKYNLSATPITQPREDTTEDQVAGVITSTYVAPTKGHTIASLATGENTTLTLKIKFNAGFLSGKLCILNKKKREIYPAEDKNLTYLVLEDISQSIRGMTVCPVCGVEVGIKKFKKHLKKIHEIGNG